MNETIHREVLRVLDEFKVPTKFVGYKYIAEAIEMTIADAGVLVSMDRRMFPVMAEEHGVSVKSIRLAIVLTINEAFNDMSNHLLWDTFERYLNYNTGSVRTKTFIRVCVDIVNKRLGADSIDV